MLYFGIEICFTIDIDADLDYKQQLKSLIIMKKYILSKTTLCRENTTNINKRFILSITRHNIQNHF